MKPAMEPAMEPAMKRITGGEAVVQALKSEGVEVVFGLPGVQIMSIFDAFYGEPGIRVITVRHEQTVGYMADGYARVTGKPGVALVAPGPGVQNASAALGTAYASSSPVLLLTGQVKRSEIGTDCGALHELNDQLDVVRPVTAWRRRVTGFPEIPFAIHEAMGCMRSGRPRPTEVEIPYDVLDMRGSAVSLSPGPPLQRPPDGESVRRACELLLSARKPFIWAGGGVNIANASSELTALAQALGAPVATTAEGKGSISENHPLALGASYYGHGASSWAAPRADVILAVGTRMTDQMAGPGAPRKSQKLIQLDADPSVLGKHHPANIGILCDARIGLQALLESVRKKRAKEARSRPPWPKDELDDIRARQERWLAEKAPDQMEMIRSIGRVLEEDTVIVAGLTNVAYWSFLGYRVTRPRSFMTASYYATLGYAFPLALGVKVGSPQRPVVALTGDGGFMYGLPELATAVQHGIAVVAVVFVDNAFGASRDDQRSRYGGRVVGTELRNPSFAEVARVFGAEGVRVEPENLGPALGNAVEAGKPALIEIPTPTWTPPFQIEPRRS
jgi:acetolactate synthase-1/2/3 large subunit